MFLSIVANWRYAMWGIVSVALVIFALQVMHWRSRAAAADVAEAEMHRVTKALVQYQVDLSAAQKRLREKKTEIVTKTNDVIRHVVKYIHDSPECSFSADVIRVLNDAKRMSPAAPGTPRDANAIIAGSGDDNLHDADGASEGGGHQADKLEGQSANPATGVGNP